MAVNNGQPIQNMNITEMWFWKRFLYGKVHRVQGPGGTQGRGLSITEKLLSN